MEENNQPQVQVNQSSWFQKVDPRTNIKGVVVLLVVIILFGGAFAWNSARQNNSKSSQNQQKQTVEKKFLSDNALVYGYWAGSSSVIEVTDLSTNTAATLATLPTNIKNVKVLSNNELLFLKDTDARDYAKSLVLYDISSKKETVIVTAEENFGIDDYFVSKNGRYITTWELSLASDSPQLIDAKSRIYSIDIQNPGQKNLIYDEVATPGNTIRYPIAITSSGEIYVNKFIPNAGMGWSYGMSVSNFTGTSRGDLTSMQDGTYANQPTLSEDESKFVFVGYDGARGDGTQIVNGAKRVFSVANTIETLDVTTKSRTKLITAQGDDVFTSATFDLTTGDILYQVVNSTTKSLETHSYSFSQNSSKKIDFDIAYDDSSKTSVNTIKTSLSNGKLLLTSVATGQSAMGNLGARYEQSLSAVSIFDQKTGERVAVNHNDSFIQFIALTDANFFDSAVLGRNAVKPQREQLQLDTFVVKPTLAPVRIARNNFPSSTNANNTSQLDCTQTAAAQACGTLTDGAEQASCVNNATNMCSGTCPLYLYGEEGTNLKVSVGIPIYSVNTAYNPEEGFKITLGNNGSFVANGKSVENISFNYNPDMKLERPAYGKVIDASSIDKTIREYAINFGLNQRETEDAVNFAKNHINSPYVFLSFYDNSLSKQILPIYFSRQPDTYRNIVFYIEQFETKPSLSPKPPVFDPIVRSGFTAIEISYIIK